MRLRGVSATGKDQPADGGVTLSTLIESDEHKALRAAVSSFARTQTDAQGLWQAAAKLGYIGVNLPEEYGGGGGGITELSLVLEELGAAGNPSS